VGPASPTHRQLYGCFFHFTLGSNQQPPDYEPGGLVYKYGKCFPYDSHYKSISLYIVDIQAYTVFLCNGGRALLKGHILMIIKQNNTFKEYGKNAFPMA
jgi:hypothetical protein